MSDALYEQRDGTLYATEFTRGPWDPNAQHGGPVGAILIRAIEALDDGGLGLHLARITIELLKPAPLGELHASAQIVRPGRRVQLLEASLKTPDGVEVAKARAVRVAPAPVDAGVQPGLEIPSFDRAEPSEFRAWDHTIFPGGGVEVRITRGSFFELGPTVGWFRLNVPVVSGEEPSPMQRVLAAADFPNGISTELSWKDWVFINPDLTVYIERLPVGEWIGVDAHMRVSEGGGAIAQGVLYDAQGRIGRSIQSLFVARRG
jgi:Thioesterase-like superfamily